MKELKFTLTVRMPEFDAEQATETIKEALEADMGWDVAELTQVGESVDVPDEDDDDN